MCYSELRKLARRMLAGDSISRRLQPTELANEAALRVLKLDHMQWNDRAHFLATAATVMRQALLDEVRRFRAGKRQMPPVLTTLVDTGVPTMELDLEQLDLRSRLAAGVAGARAARRAAFLRRPHHRSHRRRARHLAGDGQEALGCVARLAAAGHEPRMNLERERIAPRASGGGARSGPARSATERLSARSRTIRRCSPMCASCSQGGGGGGVAAHRDAAGAGADDTPPPEQIGPYRVKELLGPGGMGRVYRAERADGAFERTVAIKLMRRTRVPSWSPRSSRASGSILARLQHRNIAQLLDGGVTPDGHSYFVMELVDRAHHHPVRHRRRSFRSAGPLLLLSAGVLGRAIRACAISSCMRTSSRTTSS